MIATPENLFIHARNWIALSRGGMANAADWQDWADKQIERTENVPMWLISMSMANDLATLEAALEPEDLRIIDHRLEDNIALGSAVLAWRGGRLDFDSMLTTAGEIADCSEADVECELIFSLQAKARSNPSLEAMYSEALDLFRIPLNASRLAILDVEGDRPRKSLTATREI